MMKKPYYSVCKVCGATLDPGERCDCGTLPNDTVQPQTILENNAEVCNGDILYLCDKRCCTRCSYPTCRHTKDIRHAVNFEKASYGKNIFIEKEPQ